MEDSLEIIEIFKQITLDNNFSKVVCFEAEKYQFLCILWR